MLAATIEATALLPVVLTMGHAGPEGQFAVVGWLGPIINFPGILLARAFSLQLGSLNALIATVYITQTILFTIVAYVMIQLSRTYRNRRAL